MHETNRFESRNPYLRKHTNNALNPVAVLADFPKWKCFLEIGWLAKTNHKPKERIREDLARERRDESAATGWVRRMAPDRDSWADP